MAHDADGGALSRIIGLVAVNGQPICGIQSEDPGSCAPGGRANVPLFDDPALATTRLFDVPSEAIRLLTLAASSSASSADDLDGNTNPYLRAISRLTAVGCHVTHEHLDLAVRLGCAPALRHLLASDRSIHLDGMMPPLLCLAAEYGLADIVRVLLEDGRCDPRECGSFALSLAATCALSPSLVLAADSSSALKEIVNHEQEERGREHHPGGVLIDHAAVVAHLIQDGRVGRTIADLERILVLRANFDSLRSLLAARDPAMTTPGGVKNPAPPTPILIWPADDPRRLYWPRTSVPGLVQDAASASRGHSAGRRDNGWGFVSLVALLGEIAQASPRNSPLGIVRRHILSLLAGVGSGASESKFSPSVPTTTPVTVSASQTSSSSSSSANRVIIHRLYSYPGWEPFLVHLRASAPLGSQISAKNTLAVVERKQRQHPWRRRAASRWTTSQSPLAGQISPKTWIEDAVFLGDCPEAETNLALYEGVEHLRQMEMWHYTSGARPAPRRKRVMSDDPSSKKTLGVNAMGSAAGIRASRSSPGLMEPSDGPVMRGVAPSTDPGVIDARDRIMAKFADKVELLRSAADKGDNPVAQLHLGMHYKRMEDIVSATTWLARSAIQGLASPQFHLGALLENSAGDEDTFARLVSACPEAFASGSLAKSFNDRTSNVCHSACTLAAVEWYTRAARQKDRRAQVAAGRFHLFGIHGLQDFSKARVWFSMALDQGDDAGLAGLWILNKDTPSTSPVPDFSPASMLKPAVTLETQIRDIFARSVIEGQRPSQRTSEIADAIVARASAIDAAVKAAEGDVRMERFGQIARGLFALGLPYQSLG
jgi:TPR repeat protein